MDKMIDFMYLLDRMFPANNDSSWPAFSSLDDDTFTHVEPFFDKILPLISENREIFFEIENVNDQIKFLKKLSYTDTQAFVETAIEAYFSSNFIHMHLNDGQPKLFPNVRILPEINYDLFLPFLDWKNGK